MSRTQLSILADLNNAVFRIVLLFPSLPGRTDPLFEVHQLQLISPSVTIMFYRAFSSLARSRYFSFSFIFTLWSAGTAKSSNRQVLSFFFFFFVVDYYLV